MFCPNCGGEFADWALKCPYCGSTNTRGAEKEYMAHMEELKKRLDQVDEESESGYQKTVSRVVKRLLIFAGIAGALIVIALTVLVMWEKRLDRKSEEWQIAESAWQKEEYVKLDEMYEKCDYDGIIKEADEALTEDHSISGWEHYEYVMEFYAYYANILAARKQIEEGTGDVYTLGEGIYGALHLMKEVSTGQVSQLEEFYRQYQKAPGLTEEEGQLVREYIKEAEEFLENTLSWTQDEIDSLYESCKSDGYFSVSPCFDKAEELSESFGW